VTFTIGSASFWRDKVVLNIPVPAGTVYKMKVSALNSGNDTLLTLPRTINWESRRKSSSGKMAGKKVTIAFPAFEVNGSGYENYVRVKVAPANLVCEAPSIGQWGTASLLSYHFLEDQWSVSESPAKTLGTNYSNQRFVSLFGWATSGPYWGDDTNFYRKPNSTSVNIDKIYGPNCGFYELSDYGMYNCDWGYIYSGRPSGFAGYMAGWRTPSETEMVNLISNCNHSGLGCIKDREAKGGCYMYGLIILPKGCDVDHMPYHEDDKYSYHNKLAPGVTTFLCNVFTQDQWKVWEEEYGAVFLPCSGCRNNETVSHVTAGNSSTRADSNDYWGLYWTSTYWTDLSSLRYARFYAFKLGVAGIVPGGDITIFDTRIGMTVRLIKNVN
jgi:hypothetical protein